MKVLAATPVATLVVVLIVVIGGIKVVLGDIEFDHFVKVIGPMVGLLAIGRGLDATHKP